jgi:5'-nucleotidase / UDP-sugar diphosphatase
LSNEAPSSALLILLALLAGCATAPPPAAPEPAPDAETSVVEVTLLHINDVYEITPVEGGRSGGLARVATLRDRLAAECPHTLMLLGGDLFSPSALGTAVVAGERLAGRQMVAVLNQVGLDWATFGNHEFDVPEAAFRERLAESEFGWVSGNVTTAAGEPWPGVEPSTVVTFGAAGGPSLRLGLLGATLQTGAPDWVKVADPIPALAAQARALRGEVDVLVAVTHLALGQDKTLAETVPEIDLVLGGHEHENWALRRGPGFTPVFKADANVRSVYVLRLRYDTATRELTIADELVPVTDAIPEDPETAAVVEHWVELAFAAFRADGFEPEATVATIPQALDGYASAVRNRPTALTDLVAEAMLTAAAASGVGAQAAVFNSGSIRIDDVLPPGPLTQYDVIRVLPFGDDVVLTEMTGSLLAKVLDQGLANQGSGGYLQKSGATPAEGGGWLVGGNPLDPEATYRVALLDFLLTGREVNLGYLTRTNPDLKVLQTLGDVREAVIAELQRRYGSSPRYFGSIARQVGQSWS